MITPVDNMVIKSPAKLIHDVLKDYSALAKAAGETIVCILTEFLTRYLSQKCS